MFITATNGLTIHIPAGIPYTLVPAKTEQNSLTTFLLMNLGGKDVVLAEATTQLINQLIAVIVKKCVDNLSMAGSTDTVYIDLHKELTSLEQQVSIPLTVSGNDKPN